MPTCRIRRSLLPLAMTATLGLAGLTPATADDKPRYLPFRAGGSFTEVLGAPTAECAQSAPPGGSAASGAITGSGLASSVGSFTLTSLDCITSASPHLLPPLRFSSRQFVLTDVNGDTLVAEYEGKATELPTGFIALTGTFVFSGGSGRFHGAKGSGTIEGVEDIGSTPGGGTGHVLLMGKISR